MVGIINQLQGMARMPFLAARSPALFLAQVLPAPFLQAIAAGRLTTITAVLGQLVLQSLDTSCLLLDQDFQLLQPSQQNLNQINEVWFSHFFQLVTLEFAR